MGNANEKILVESNLYDIKKFRKIMIIIGVVLMIIVMIGIIIYGINDRNKKIARYKDNASDYYDSYWEEYNDYVDEFNDDVERWGVDTYLGYTNAEAYADHWTDDDIALDMFPGAEEALKKGKDAYVEGYIADRDIGLFVGEELTFVILGIGLLLFFALVGQLCYLAFRKISITVTDKRVTGKTLWGRQVELPRNQISAIAIGWLKSIAIASSSGKIHFYLIKNRDEVFQILSDLLKEKQDMPIEQTSKYIAPPQSTEADELAKFKALLDNGAITQEEYEAKKKQVLGL